MFLNQKNGTIFTKQDKFGLIGIILKVDGHLKYNTFQHNLSEEGLLVVS